MPAERVNFVSTVSSEIARLSLSPRSLLAGSGSCRNVERMTVGIRNILLQLDLFEVARCHPCLPGDLPWCVGLATQDRLLWLLAREELCLEAVSDR